MSYSLDVYFEVEGVAWNLYQVQGESSFCVLTREQVWGPRKSWPYHGMFDSLGEALEVVVDTSRGEA